MTAAQISSLVETAVNKQPTKLCDEKEKSFDEKVKLQEALVGALEDLTKGPAGTVRGTKQASATMFNKKALTDILARAKNN